MSLFKNLVKLYFIFFTCWLSISAYAFNPLLGEDQFQNNQIDNGRTKNSRSRAIVVENRRGLFTNKSHVSIPDGAVGTLSVTENSIYYSSFRPEGIPPENHSRTKIITGLSKYVYPLVGANTGRVYGSALYYNGYFYTNLHVIDSAFAEHETLFVYNKNQKNNAYMGIDQFISTNNKQVSISDDWVALVVSSFDQSSVRELSLVDFEPGQLYTGLSYPISGSGQQARLSSGLILQTEINASRALVTLGRSAQSSGSSGGAIFLKNLKTSTYGPAGLFVCVDKKANLVKALKLYEIDLEESVSTPFNRQDYLKRDYQFYFQNQNKSGPKNSEESEEDCEPIDGGRGGAGDA